MPVDGLGTVTFVTGSNDTDAKSSWGVGFSKALGGGATLAGAYGSANGNDVADLGIGSHSNYLEYLKVKERVLPALFFDVKQKLKTNRLI